LLDSSLLSDQNIHQFFPMYFQFYLLDSVFWGLCLLDIGCSFLFHDSLLRWNYLNFSLLWSSVILLAYDFGASFATWNECHLKLW